MKLFAKIRKNIDTKISFVLKIRESRLKKVQPTKNVQPTKLCAYTMQLVTPSVVAIAVAIDTISWIISFQVFLLVSVLIVVMLFLSLHVGACCHF